VFLAGAGPAWISQVSGALHRFEKAQMFARVAGQAEPLEGSRLWRSAREQGVLREQRKGECPKAYPQS
jgi:hypothetical protein